MTPDLLADVEWQCACAAPASPNPFAGVVSGNGSAPPTVVLRATVPGTAAGAMRAAGLPITGRNFDADDWWYRCIFDGSATAGQRYFLDFEGLATVTDVWLNGRDILHSDNMFRPRTVPVSDLPAVSELLLRFTALDEILRGRRPRPRWKVARLGSQNLRWIRTTQLGRLRGWPETPAPVGPWRPITLRSARPVLVHKLVTDFRDDVGRIDVLVTVPGARVDSVAEIAVAGRNFPLNAGEDGLFSGAFDVEGVRPWWPHTHGDQPLYPVEMNLDGVARQIGRVGFRSVSVDRSDENFTVSINGVAVFCRGAYWTPLDQVGFVEHPAALRAALQQVRDGSMNMLRIGGETVYPGPEMLRLCDELGLMLWQDCMFAFVDVPQEPELTASIEAELRYQLQVLTGHPCVTVVSGGSEIEQQSAFYGLPVGTGLGPVHETLLPDLVAQALPGLPFTASTPTGGVLPTDSRHGVAHYFGVGAYLRAPEDARRAEVRFAAECLAFSNPPERVTVDERCGGAARAGHHPLWKAAVYRDAGTSWDFEDVREYYVSQLFGEQRPPLRFTDPERALDLGRAAIAQLFTSTLSEWRRPGSTCSGAMVFHHHDSVPGAGLGMVDALGRPKSAWYAMRRTMAPVAVLLTDEGLDGLDAHLINDTATAVTGVLRIDLYADGELLVESAESTVNLQARCSDVVALGGLFGGFRDLNSAHHFGPTAYDVVVVSLFVPSPLGPGTHSVLLSQAVFHPDRRELEPDVGLSASTTRSNEGQWLVRISTRRFAQWVSVECSDNIPDDSWFHLPPGGSRVVTFHGDQAPRGTVRALNSRRSARISAPA